MNKSWLNADRRLTKYEVRVKMFLKFASNNENNSEYIHWPCGKCANMNFWKD